MMQAASTHQHRLVVESFGLVLRTRRPNADIDAEDRIAHAQLVALVQVELRKVFLGSLLGTQAVLPLANDLTVDEGAVEAPHVPHPEVRRADVDQAVEPRDVAVEQVVGQPRVAALRPPEDVPAGPLEDELLSFEDPFGNRQGDGRRHVNLLSDEWPFWGARVRWAAGLTPPVPDAVQSPMPSTRAWWPQEQT